MTVPERAVFDTNVWISGLLWRGKPYQCLLSARTNPVEVACCQSMAAELARKLGEVSGFTEKVIASGDHHLPEMGEYEGIEILSPAGFLRRFG